MKDSTANVGVLLVIAIIVVASFFLGIQFMEELRSGVEQTEVTNEELKERIEEAGEDIEVTRKEIEEIRAEVDKLKALRKVMEQWLEEWGIDVFELTFYAPLDPNAVEGMCYSGDPNTTASGAPVVIGETAAGGPDFPFGTRVWIMGYGWRTITDRGGDICNESIDIAVWSRAKAYAHGRVPTLAIYQKR